MKPRDILDIERIANDIPSKIQQHMELLNIIAKDVQIMVVNELMLGPSFQTIAKGNSFKFSMGERAFIDQIIQCTISNDTTIFLAPVTKHFTTTTTTFVGEIFGQIERNAYKNRKKWNQAKKWYQKHHHQLD